jgi:hypothetical protein
MRLRSLACGAAALALLTGACTDGTGNPLAVTATGSLASQVFLDRNGNGQFDASADAVAPGVQVSLLRGNGDTVSVVTTDDRGVGIFSSVPVGSYHLTVGAAVLGDTLEFAGADTAAFQVVPGDTTLAVVSVGYSQITAAQLDTARAGRTVAMVGVALHAANVFGDSLLDVADSTGAFRVAGVSPRAAVGLGDSVRIVGRVGTYLGRPALVEPAAIYPLGKGTVPEPVQLTTSVAATARGGDLDAALVRVQDAEVLTLTSSGDVLMRVSDGSGALDVVLDRNVAFSPKEPLGRGVDVDVTGVLVPDSASGTWKLKPRSNADLTVRVPRVTIDEARHKTPGLSVALTGVLLDAQLPDGSVHLADPTGFIRVFLSSGAVLSAGDSVRVIGTVGSNNGQPALASASVTVLGAGQPYAPISVTTANAASARGGQLDAALVRIQNAAITAIAPASGGGAVLTVNDNSGSVQVVLDTGLGISSSGLAVGDHVDVVGLLRPVSPGTWALYPRSQTDVTER